MKLKNLFIFLAILVIASMVFVACAPATEEPVAEEPAAEEPMEEEPAEEPAVMAGTVGVVLPTREEPRWIQDETRFEDAFAAAGYEVEILFSEGDSAKERTNVENLITKGVEVIIICPHDGTAAAAAAEAAHEAGVKVISYDRLIRDTDAVDYYVTFDSIAVGAAQAQYLVDKASGTDNPLYLYAGAASDNNAFLFFEGAWNVLQPKIADGTFYVVNSTEAVGLQDNATLTRDEMGKIIGQVTTEWDFDTAKTLAESNLTAASADDKGDVFILAPNDGTARAIADAFGADADVTSYVVTGQDAEIASVQYIIDGKQSMTVLKDVRTLVADAIAAAVAYLEGSMPPETNTYNNGVIDVPAKPSEVISVDKDNVQAAIIDSGYWDASEFTGLGEAPAEEMMGYEGKSVEAPDCDYGGKIKSIVAVDQYTVEFTMCKPDPAFPTKAAFTPFGIYPEEWIMANANEANQETLLSAPVGTGPFYLDDWARGDSVIMKRFDDYWGDAAPFETLVFRWATEGAARLLELQAGTVDQITNLSPDDFETVKADSNLTFLPVANPNILYLAMTNIFEPFDNQLVRQAIAMGIDRQRIVDNFYPEGSVVPTHFTPCSIANGCVGDSWYEFDPEAARALLAEAGYPDGFETSIFYRDVFRGYLPEPGLVAVEFQTQLRENLGIEAEVVVMESGEFIADTADGMDGFYLLGWGADYPHVTNFLDFHFGQANPQFGNPYPEIYEPLEKASQIGDPAQAEALYIEANNAIKELVPMVPIANGASASAALATVENAHFRPFGAPLFARVNPGKDTFVFMQNAEPISLFCADETDGESLAPCQQIVEPLLGYAIDSGNVEPRLATSCEPNDDSTVWTCYLREGVVFHDGSTFDANDVIVSWAAGIDAANPYHLGNTGVFEYYAYLWDNLMNVSE